MKLLGNKTKNIFPGEISMKKLIMLSLLLLTGCAVFVGSGIESFKERGKVYSQNFDNDIASCYRQTSEFLKALNAYIYRENPRKGWIIAMHFHHSFKYCIDTTEVAIIFTELKPGVTQVEVASLNSRLSNFVSSNLFATLEE